MYTVTVEASFSAVHRLRLPDGSLEPLHGHDWLVRAFFSRSELDRSSMVIDFHEAQSHLHGVLGELHHRNLSEVLPPETGNPTAESVAKHVYDRLCARGLSCLRRIEVTEAPGCVAGFEPAGGDAKGL